MRDLSEFNKLEEYLKVKGIPYERISKDTKYDPEHPYCIVELERHQLIVYDERGNRLWDAICHDGSYGAEEGLLEIYGEIVSPMAGDSVEGWLTAEDVIKRIDQREEKKHEID